MSWHSSTNNFNNPSPYLVNMEKVLTGSKPHTTLKFKQSGSSGKLQGITLKPGEDTKVTIHYTIPAGTPPGDYCIAATLKVGGNNVNDHMDVVNVT